MGGFKPSGAKASSPRPPSSAGEERKSIVAAGKVLFAAVLPPKDADAEDASVAVKSALATAPAHYAVLERECGAIVYVGAGTPRASAPGPAHAPQVFATDDEVVVLVSSTLDAPRVARAFRDAREGDDEPRARAIALKLAVRALSDESHRFSFVVLDLASGRVFAASTALSAPLALGHAHDGTLVVTCTRSGARAATSWPPKWSHAAPAATAGAKPRRDSGSNKRFGFGVSPSTPLAHAARSVSPSTDRSRSLSPSACSERSGASAYSSSWSSDASFLTDRCGGGGGGGGAPTRCELAHLPAGRFVYGRRYLQPFEFSAFWQSAQTNRGGVRAAAVGDASATKSGAGSPARSWGGSPASDGGGGGGGGEMDDRAPGSGEMNATKSAPSRSDEAASWRRRPPLSGEERKSRTTTGEEDAAAAAAAAPRTPKSAPIDVPGRSRENNTWPAGEKDAYRGVSRQGYLTNVDPFGGARAGGGGGGEERKSSGGGGGGAATPSAGKWVPKGRWRRVAEEEQERGRSGSPRTWEPTPSETWGGRGRKKDQVDGGGGGLTRAFSQPEVAASS